MQRLLNFSTHPGDPELFGDDWNRAAKFLELWEFDGFELYPVGKYPFEKIPPSLVNGLHLRFFVFLQQIWRGDTGALLDLFGTMDNVRHFYGGIDRECVVRVYREQFELAHRLGCTYVVFHPAHCNLDHIYDWLFPYHWQDTLDMCSELLNEALRDSPYHGLLLFENLWWPGSFRLHSPKEYEYLRQRVEYDRCGIVLDTGHLLSSYGGFDNEAEAIKQLLNAVRELGGQRKEIQAVHLTCNLSGPYIRHTRQQPPDNDRELDFWVRLEKARKHVAGIDPHEPFSDPAIAGLFDLIDPKSVVFEFTFKGLDAWQRKIQVQKTAMERCLWS